LKKSGLFHGRINTSNVFINLEQNHFDIKISDYGLSNVLQGNDRLSLEEGSRYDIICLGPTSNHKKISNGIGAISTR